MGVLSINDEQLEVVLQMHERIDNGVTPADIWSKLASFGDSYAKSAAQVLEQPGSLGWNIVRGVWHAAGADFGKFNEVAKAHLANYINDVKSMMKNGKADLPTSRHIENSYAAALDESDISLYAAVDIVIGKINQSFLVGPPHWYNMSGIVELEAERIRPSDPSLLERLDAEKARSIWLQTGIHGVTNTLSTAPATMQGALGIQWASWIYGGDSFSISNAGGVSYYFNAETRNWAFFDANGAGRAFIDGKLRNIDQSSWRHDAASGQYELLRDDGRWQTAGAPASALKMAAVDGSLYLWSPGGLSSAYRLAALDRANLLALDGVAGDGPSAPEAAMRNARQRADAWSRVLGDYPAAYLAADSQGNYLLVDDAGVVIGRIEINGTSSVSVKMVDGHAVAVHGDGQYTLTRRNTFTGVHETVLYRADGKEIGVTPDATQSAAYGAGVTVSVLNLVRAIQSGKPLPMAVAGINTLAAINPTNTVLSAGSSVVGAVGSLINLQKNIRDGDTFGAMVAGASVLYYSSAIYAGAAQQSSALATTRLAQDIAREKAATSGASTSQAGTMVSYANLAYCLSERDYVGATLAAWAIAFPGAAPFLAVAGVVIGMATDQDLPSAIVGCKWADDGSVAVDVRWSVGGGDRIASAQLQSYLDALTAIINGARTKNPEAQLGLVANRLPTLQFSTHGCVITDIDPVTGQERSLSYDRDGRPTDAVPGSSEFFRSLNEQFIFSALGREAIAASWEAATAWRQTQAHDPQAGLTELQRAQRNNQLAPASDIGSASQTWRPVVLDLDGNGLQLLGKDSNGVYFDIDSSGFLKNTTWIGPQDAFLVLDRNCNGFIEDGSELFSNGKVSDVAKGLASLRWIDANVDAVIDAADPVFDQLRIWQDANGNGTLDAGEATTLRQRGVTALHYTLGSYRRNGQSLQLASPDLLADGVGTRTHALEGGILVESSSGTVSMVVSRTEDLSHLKPGKDHIKDAIEDVPVHILAGQLLENDRLGGTTGAGLRMTAVGGARFGTVSLQHGVLHFTPEPNYFGSAAGFSYTVSDGDGRTSQCEVAITFAAVNDSPLISSDGHEMKYIYGYATVYPNGTPYDGNTNTNEPVWTVPVWNPSPGRETPVDYVDGRRGRLIAVDPDDTVLTYGVSVGGVTSQGQPWPGGHNWAWGVRYNDQLHEYVRTKAPMVFGTRLGWVTLENDGTWVYEPRVSAFLAPHDAFELTVTDSHGQAASTMVIIKMPPWEPPRYFENPIVLDLDRNGIELQPVGASRAFYDIQDDGWRYRMGWISAGDALLALDANDDGEISGRGELSFRDYLPGAQTDLEGLAGFDGNADGSIDSNDAIWRKLRVWRDDNVDGQSAPGELMSLDDAGVARISLVGDGRYAQSNGNVIHAMLQLTMTDGSTLDAADAAFERSDEVLFVRSDGTREVVRRAAYAPPSELVGSDGADLLLGTTGSNHILGGPGNDVVLDDQGNDVIEAGDGDDTIHAGAHDDVVAGGAGDDTVFAGDGNDMVWGGAGADFLMAQAGNDIVFGGDGSDLLFGEGGSDILSGDLGADLLYGGDDADGLFGGAGDDLLAGGAGPDQLQGDEGNDTLDGGGGADVLSGGDGDDLYFVDDPGDSVIERVDEGLDTVRTHLDGYTLPDHVENLTLIERPDGATDATATLIRGSGNALDNLLVGARQAVNHLYGDAGNDTLQGGQLGDLLFGGEGDDRLEGGIGDDRLVGGAGDDTYVFRRGDGSDVVQLHDANATGNLTADRDVIHFEDIASSDLMCLHRSERDLVVHYHHGDTLEIEGYYRDISTRPARFSFADGVSWSPTQLFEVYPLQLSEQDDDIFLDNVEALTANGEAGNDTMHAGSGNTALLGGDGSDTLHGGTGNDLLLGEYGDDVLDGGGGHNFLAGGRGNDIVASSAGGDLLAFNRGDGRDVVRLLHGQEKTLSLGGGILYSDLALRKSGGDLLLRVGGDDQINFENWYGGAIPEAVSHGLSTLQLVLEDSRDHVPRSRDKLHNHKVQRFDFEELVRRYDEARIHSGSRESWALSGALRQAHLGGSDSIAIGGDLSLAYARGYGSLVGVSDMAVQAGLASPTWGKLPPLGA